MHLLAERCKRKPPLQGDGPCVLPQGLLPAAGSMDATAPAAMLDHKVTLGTEGLLKDNRRCPGPGWPWRFYSSIELTTSVFSFFFFLAVPMTTSVTCAATVIMLDSQPAVPPASRGERETSFSVLLWVSLVNAARPNLGSKEKQKS